jgi:hypothetical protein
MRVGDLVKFEHSMHRYVEGAIRSIFREQGIVKMKVQYGPTSFVTLRPEHVIGARKAAEIKRPALGDDEDVRF